MKPYAVFSGLLGIALVGAGIFWQGKRRKNPANKSFQERGDNRQEYQKDTEDLSLVDNGERIIGSDNKGRTLYQGKRGGQFYLTASGGREYIRKDRAR